MRLIDADKLMEDFQNTITENSDTMDWINMINRQPTAYNLENVVEQLEEMSEIYCKEYQEKEGSLYLNDAIEIVRKGGA